MDEGAKRRLVGAAVLVALAVIFVPMLLNDKADDGLGEPIVIPDSPEFDTGFADPGEAVAEDAAGDRIPALPSPEPPTGGLAPLPVPEPPGQALSSAQPHSQASPEPRPVTPAPRPSAVGPKPVPAGAAAWVIQVASVGSSSSAEKLRDELRGKGYPAFVEQARVNGKLYFRVRVGPETSRGRADGVAAKLQRETGNKPLVQRYR